MRMLTPAERWLIVRGHARHALRPIVERQPGHDVSDEPRDEHGQWTTGGGDGDGGGGYVSTPATPDKPPGDVDRVHRPDATNRNAFKAVNITPLTFHELKSDGAQRFHDAIAKAAAASPYGAAVAVHAPSEYAGMRTFLTPDQKVGFALHGDNIVSLFKHPDSTAKSAAASALTLAAQQGGRRLDAFDTVLPRLYSEAGFRAVARLPFNEKFAPPGWDKEKFAAFNGGKPDIVFMAYDPQHPHEYQPGEGKAVETYEQGEQAQQDFLKSLDTAHAEAKPKPETTPTTAMTQMELWPGKFPDIPPPKAKLQLDDFKGKVTLDDRTKDDPA
ncbi:MAG: hypothetical protein J2P55_01360, partial [Rhizobiales bacterium]|nr:hypothetical protein [Hyphomicrobiales bacterium]